MRKHLGGRQYHLLTVNRVLEAIGLALVVISSIECTPTQGTAGDGLGTKRDKMRCGNGLGVTELALNAISTNRNALDQLISHTLTTATFALGGPTTLHFGLVHDRARRFMGYLVNCALRTSQAPVEYDNPFPPHAHSTFRGAMGLCEQWGTGPFPLPSDCLERVGACVYGARVNPELKRVPISLRGEYPANPDVFRLLPAIETDVHQRLSHLFVPSFGDCASPTSGETRNCGWTPSFAGICTPGAVVAVSAGAPRVDTCSGPVLGSGILLNVLRACSGIYGCDFGAPLHLASSSPNQCIGFPGPGVIFTCPSTGDFSVMVGPLVSGSPTDAVADADGADGFPGRELDVFANVEMAVYGNPFLSSQINPHILDVFVDLDTGGVVNEDQNLPIQDGPIFMNMWSCWARQWSAQQAYLAHRLCGVPGQSNCIANMLDACFRTSPLDSQCDLERGTIHPEAGDFERCRDGFGNTWLSPITTYLNQPCDALAEQDRDFCQRGCGFGGGTPGGSSASGLIISELPSTIQAAQDDCDVPL